MKDDKSLFKKSLARILLFVAGITLLAATPGMAGYATDALGGTLRVMGYITQGAQWGTAGDQYDTKQGGIQAALTQALLEIAYEPTTNLSVFISGNLNMDQAYLINEDSDEWKKKQFNNAKDDLYVLDEPYTLLKECHVTFATGNLIWRLGKQIVSWGEMDGVRVMDAINPQDIRRGITDVQFETTIIPLWMAKLEYCPDYVPSFMQSISYEFTFSPNAEHIDMDHSGDSVNHKGGIWAYNVILAPGTRLGSLQGALPNALTGGATNYETEIENPNTFNSDGFEYAGRIKAYVADGILTLNYFHGVADDPSINFRNLWPAALKYQSDPNNFILDYNVEGKYADLEFAGFTFTREIGFLKIRPFGNISPVLRMEALYGMDSTYGTTGKDATGTGLFEELEEYDETKLGLALDYKIKIPFLNPRENFSITPQFIWHRILDFPDRYMLGQSVLTFTENNHVATLMIRTSYLHAKLAPMIFWQHYWHRNQVWDIGLFKLDYTYNNTWSYGAMYVLVNGDMVGQYFGNKDNIAFTVSYKF